MMKICVCSDSHGKHHLLESIVKKERPDAFFFLGDGERDVPSLSFAGEGLLVAVRGNCDFSSHNPLERIMTLEDKRLLLTHGHLYGVKSGLSGLARRGQEAQADIIVYGHTHRADAQILDGRLFLNPGAVSGTPESYLILHLEAGRVDYFFRQL